ncbi:MAG: hypothetical protein IJ561_08015 [Ruminococcus sp.]|nr:hypothetical protein [Ruminococcus sp.]
MKAYLIDFENVKSKGLVGIEQLGEDDKVIIFYSENSDTISFEMHCKVMTSRADIEYLKVRVGGKNALDFQLSTLLGYLLAKGSYTHIFIISGDKGFDKLHDFWNVSFADKNSCTVFRTQTIAAAVTFAANRPAAPLPAAEPETLPAAEAPAEDPEVTLTEPAPQPEPVLPEEVVITKKESPRKRGRRPQSTEEIVKSSLLGKFDLSDEEIASVVSCVAESEDKEDFHNALAKIFKAQATDLYKVLRPKYLKLKEGLTAEAPAKASDPIDSLPLYGKISVSAEPEKAPEPEAAPEPVPEPEPAPVEEAKPAKAKKKPTRRKPKAKVSALRHELDKLLASSCSEEEIACVERLIGETDSKQKLYLSIVKEYRKDRGCEIYKLIKSEYNALAALKETAEV